jgi:HSP20 family protein
MFMGRREMGDDLGRMLDQLDDGGRDPSAAECRPPCDVVETDAAIELVMDLPGVSEADVRILFTANTLVIAGRKLPAACQHGGAAFHLAERTFGRFARAVHLTGAFDAGAARATLKAGELRVVLPRIADRRGREIRIPVQAE